MSILDWPTSILSASASRYAEMAVIDDRNVTPFPQRPDISSKNRFAFLQNIKI
jgi:hypothetical protein